MFHSRGGRSSECPAPQSECATGFESLTQERDDALSRIPHERLEIESRYGRFFGHNSVAVVLAQFFLDIHVGIRKLIAIPFNVHKLLSTATRAIPARSRHHELGTFCLRSWMVRSFRPASQAARHSARGAAQIPRPLAALPGWVTDQQSAFRLNQSQVVIEPRRASCTRYRRSFRHANCTCKGTVGSTLLWVGGLFIG